MATVGSEPKERKMLSRYDISDINFAGEVHRELEITSNGDFLQYEDVKDLLLSIYCETQNGSVHALITEAIDVPDEYLSSE